MVRVFLDSNFVIETIGLRRSAQTGIILGGKLLYLSPISIEILCYVFKIKVPDDRINTLLTQTCPVDLTQQVLLLSAHGPTDDIEDNIQLQSATQVQADYFLTNDQKLLKMRFFGKTQIIDSFPTPKA